MVSPTPADPSRSNLAALTWRQTLSSGSPPLPRAQAWSSQLKKVGPTVEAEYYDYTGVTVSGYNLTDSVALVSQPLRFAAQPPTLPRPLYILTVVCACLTGLWGGEALLLSLTLTLPGAAGNRNQPQGLAG
jgi:hypothetical protein